MSVLWSPKEHYRFKRSDRSLVHLLLWISKQTRCTVKDVWIWHIIPYCIDILQIPTIYVSDIPFETSEKELEMLLPIKIDWMQIAKQRNGHSKGYGWCKPHTYDDLVRIMQKKLWINGQEVFFGLMSTDPIFN